MIRSFWLGIFSWWLIIKPDNVSDSSLPNWKPYFWLRKSSSSLPENINSFSASCLSTNTSVSYSSCISPKSSSSTSSMVMMPAVPPNSSTTQAILFLSFVNLLIRPDALMLSGTAGIGNSTDFISVGFLNISNWCT